MKYNYAERYSDNKKMETKSNKVMIISLVILSLLVFGLGGYIVYDKVWLDKPSDENNESNDVNKENSSSNHSDNQNNNGNSKNDKQDGTDENNNSNKDIYTKILNGDFSGVAGEYMNFKGETITLLSNGLLESENGFTIETPIVGSEIGAYQWNVSGGQFNNFVRNLVPIGTSLGNLLIANPIIEDNTTKIRLFSGQGIPGYDEIYFKK